MAVAGDNGAARVTRLMYFGKNVETSGFGVRLYQETFSVVVNDFVTKHTFNVDLYPLDVIGNIVVKRSVEFGVIELS